MRKERPSPRERRMPPTDPQATDDGLSMWQAKIVTPTTFVTETVPRPRLQGPEEVLLRTAVSGICSGDLMPWYLQKKVGTVLGHEVVGYAAEVGSAVRHIRTG